MSFLDEIDNVLAKDPAARSRLEVLLCYPGLHAIYIHRVAHWLWQSRLFTAARFISQFGRMLTGIEIHPGATIARRVFIDHGMGVVIGETAEVGEGCVLYQGVTLGAGAAARKGAETRGVKRHPTLGPGVVVGSGAEIQGPIHVGENVQVASGSIVLKDVPANSIVVGVPGRVIYRDGKKVAKEEVPDIEAEAIKALKDRVKDLERKIVMLTQCLDQNTRQALELEMEQTEIPESTTSTDDSEDPVEVFLHGAGI